MIALPLLRDSEPRRSTKTGVPQPTLTVVPRRRRWPAVVAGLAWSLVSCSLLGAAVFHTQLAERQLRLDRLDRQVAIERERFDELRYERAELRSPVRLAAAASELGMRRGARQHVRRPSRPKRSRGNSPPPDRSATTLSGSCMHTEPLDQFRGGQERDRGHPVKPVMRSHGVPSTQRSGSARHARRRPPSGAGEAHRAEASTPDTPTRRRARRAADRADEAHCRATLRPDGGSAPPRSRHGVAVARHAPVARRRQPPVRARGRRCARPRRAQRVSRFRAGSPRRRLILALVVIGAVLLGLIGRVAYLQTTEADDAAFGRRRSVDALGQHPGTARHGVRPQRRRAGDVGAGRHGVDQPQADRQRTGHGADPRRPVGPFRRQGHRAARRDRHEGSRVRLRAAPGRRGHRRPARPRCGSPASTSTARAAARCPAATPDAASSDAPTSTVTGSRGSSSSTTTCSRGPVARCAARSLPAVVRFPAPRR